MKIQIIDVRDPEFPKIFNVGVVVSDTDIDITETLEELCDFHFNKVTLFVKYKAATEFKMVTSVFDLEDPNIETILIRSRYYCVSYGDEGFNEMLREGERLYTLFHKIKKVDFTSFNELPKEEQREWAGKVHFAFHHYHCIYTEPDKYGSEENKEIVQLYHHMLKHKLFSKEDYL